MKSSVTEELSENIEVATPGYMLKEARVRLHFSVEDMAKRLNLKASLIVAIEANEFDDIPSVTFTRGYLKGYAKLLHIDETEVLEAFEYLNTVERKQLEMQSFSNRSSQKNVDNWLSIVSVLVVLVIVILAVVWWWQRNESLNTGAESLTDKAPIVQNTTSDPNSADEQSAVKLDQAIDPNNTPPNDVVDDSDPQLTETIDNSISAVNPTVKDTDNQSDEQPAVVMSHLELRFSDSCWINIADATGNRIAIGTKVKGHVTSVTGVAPFSIKLGKPEAVTVRLDGKVMAIPYYAKGSVANFVLPSNE